jgi:LuxR family transcriptional regulator, maltose regulon positive regulatory protein
MGGSGPASRMAERVVGLLADAHLAVPVLPSRLTPPPVRRGTVARPGLVRRLPEAAEAPVVAIAAPAGYGKTTLLAEWADRDPRPFGWLRADRRFNDPAVLVSYLATVLASVIPVERAVFDQLAAPHRPQRAAAVAGLAASASQAPHPFVLVVDDVHLLTGTESLDTAGTLVDHLPDGSQLALAGRQEPELGLPRLRSEGRVLDIGAQELQQDPAGARQLLAAAGVELADSELAELMARTEGWPAGLYFAALARNTDAFPHSRASGFEGGDRLLTDYIRSEFLSHLPAGHLRFLTRTSILDELSGPLCDAVLQQQGSAAMLEEIEASNLLLVPLDRQRRWYRYHHLFQDMLRHELDRAEPAAAPELALRASAWCEANDLFDSAVHYAQQAADTSRVGQLMIRGSMRQYASGRAAALHDWFGWLAARDCRDGAVAVLGAWLNMLSGKPADADRWAAVATAAAPLDAQQPDGSPLEAWVLTLRAARAQDVQQMRTDAARALQLLSPGSQWRPNAAATLGQAQYYQGNLDAADTQLAQAAELGVSLRAPAAAAVALAGRAIIAILQDRWHDASTQLAQASSLIGAAHLESYPISALVYAVRARVAAHFHDPWSARRELSAAGKLLPALTRALPQVAIQARLEFIRACVTLGDALAAEDLLAEASDLLHAGHDFGLLQADADELSALLAQVRAASPRLAKLSPAELRLLPLLATQLTYRQIADQLTVSVHTVKAQVTSVYRKLEVSSRTQAIEQARGLGLLPG